MSGTEIVYIGDYDNTNDFILQSDGVAIDMSNITRIDANINGQVISSTNLSTDLIRWDQSGFQTGEIRCKFGTVVPTIEGLYGVTLIIFDVLNPKGVIFPVIPITAVALPNAA